MEEVEASAAPEQAREEIEETTAEVGNHVVATMIEVATITTMIEEAIIVEAEADTTNNDIAAIGKTNKHSAKRPSQLNKKQMNPPELTSLSIV